MPGPRRVIRRRGGNKRRTGGLPSKPNVRNLSDKELMQRIGKVKVKPYETYDILGYYPELEPYIMEANRRGLMKGVNLTEKGYKILKEQRIQKEKRMRGGVLYAAEVPLEKPIWRVIFRTPSHGVLAATGFEDYKSRKKAEQRLKWLKKNGYIAKLVKVETKEVISEE